MGQPAFAFSAAFCTAARSAPGACAVTTRWLEVTANPASVFSNVTVADASILFGVIPASPSCAENAIAKQPACAAAINSSGFVPLAPSNRVANVYGICDRTPLAAETSPLPSFNPPCQTAEALLCMIPPREVVDYPTQKG